MIVGIILAAGEGTRIKSKDRNKVTLPFLNKPMICYAVELLAGICDKVIVVVGAFHESVRQVLKNYEVTYAFQKKRLGTGHAVKVAFHAIENKHLSPAFVLIAYGDHAMFYQKQTVSDLMVKHKKEQSSVSFITTEYDKPDELVWGRVIRDTKGNIVKIVEQKDASSEERNTKELNAGFYCIDYKFLKRSIRLLNKSSATGEYYLTDLIGMALEQKKKVLGLKVPFEGVGIGINKYQELDESQRMYLTKPR